LRLYTTWLTSTRGLAPSRSIRQRTRYWPWGLFKRGETMNPELAAFLQQQMWLTDDEISAIVKDPSELEALLDVVFEVS